MRRAILASVGVAALVVSLGPVSAASAAQRARTSGPEKVFVLPHDTTSGAHPGTVLMTGTIADYGKSVATNADGKPTKEGTYRVLELTKGTILVNITSLDEAINTAFMHAAFDTVTCSVSAPASGTITIVSGTKAYSGITGSFIMGITIAEIAPRTKSGSCTTKTTTPAVAAFYEATGSGKVTLP